MPRALGPAGWPPSFAEGDGRTSWSPDLSSEEPLAGCARDARPAVGAVTPASEDSTSLDLAARPGSSFWTGRSAAARSTPGHPGHGGSPIRRNRGGLDGAQNGGAAYAKPVSADGTAPSHRRSAAGARNERDMAEPITTPQW